MWDDAQLYTLTSPVRLEYGQTRTKFAYGIFFQVFLLNQYFVSHWYELDYAVLSMIKVTGNYKIQIFDSPSNCILRALYDTKKGWEIIRSKNAVEIENQFPPPEDYLKYLPQNKGNGYPLIRL